MRRDFSVVIERDEEGYYVASVLALPGCHTQARSLDELMDRVREAIGLYLEVEAEETGGLEFVGIQRVSVPASGKLPALTGADVIQALERGGFSVVRIRGSHHFLRHADGRATVVPVHAGETIGPGLMSKILRDGGLDREQFRGLLS